MIRPIALACSVLATGCSIDNPFFDLAPNTGDVTSSTGAATGGSTGVAPTTGSIGETTSDPGSTAALTDGGTGTTRGPGTTGSTGGVLTGDTTGAPDTGETSTGELSTGETSTGEGVLDPGEHTLFAAAHCVGANQEFTVTMSADECAELMAKEEAAAKNFFYCPGLDPAEFGLLAVDFHDGRSNSHVTTHLRFVVPPLAPGHVATGAVLAVTAGCNAQFVAGKLDNLFKPGNIWIDECDKVPKFDGDKHPEMLSQLAIDGVAEIGGKVMGALEPGERVEWKIGDDSLTKLLAGDEVCLGIWSQFNVGNEVHYQGSDAPHPPSLSFVVQPG